MKELTYTSYAVKPFDTWRLFITGFFILLVLFSFVGLLFLESFFLSAMFSIAGALGHIAYFYTIAKFNGKDIQISNNAKTLHLSSVSRIETWWCYEIGMSSYELNGANTGQMRPHTNKINIYMKLEGKGEPFDIYEQIHLSEKFPNNHVYNHHKVVDEYRKIRVWDLDACIAKLGLENAYKHEA